MNECEIDLLKIVNKLGDSHIDIILKIVNKLGDSQMNMKIN